MSSEHTKPGHAVHETAPMHDPTDAWHDHSQDADKPQHAHAEVGNPGLIIGVGIAAFLLVCASVLAIQGYYTHYTTERLNALERQSGNTGERVWKEKLARRDDEMAQYVWADHDRVQMPLEIGVAKVLEDYAQAPKPQPAASPRGRGGINGRTR